MRSFASLLVLVSSAFLALGITLPLITFERLIFFTDQPSLAGIIIGLGADGDLLLAIIVALVSIVFPVAKLIGLQLLLTGDPERLGHVSRIVGLLSKWSMMDVMLVAIVIFAAKTSGLAAAFTQAGLWCYAVSALASAVAAMLVPARREQASSVPTDQ